MLWREVTHALQCWLTTLPRQTKQLVVAYSGGRDSHVLLHALSHAPTALQLSAIHINHGLQSEAEDWALHCQKVCESLSLSLISYPLKLIPAKGESIEALAREARLAIFAKTLKEHAMLLTAHHQSDQAETILLQLLRGAGPLGLSAMPALKSLGQGQCARPLLSVSSQAIAAYANHYQLTWVEDPSNQQTRFTRNAIRHHIMPRLAAINPEVSACLSRGAMHCAQTQALLDEFLDEALLQCLGKDDSLNLCALSAYAPSRQSALLRHWLRKQKILMPSAKQLDIILQQFLNAAADAQPLFSLKTGTLQRFQNHLYFVPEIKTPAPLFWDLSHPLSFNGRTWITSKQPGAGLSMTQVGNRASIRFRQGGEWCRPCGKPHSRALKKWLQEYRVPVWERASLPLLYCEDELVAVGSLFVCEGWQVKSPADMGWVIFSKARRA